MTRRSTPNRTSDAEPSVLSAFCECRVIVEVSMEKRPALGKGLSALIPDAPEPPRSAPLEVDIDRLTPNDFQPRGARRRRAAARSWRSRSSANGIIQPIVVRRVGDRFQIIAGERRWRAAQKAGLLRVPVVVRDVAPGQEQSLLEMALDRKHPARESESDRRGARLSPAGRRVSPDAGRHRRPRSARTARRSRTTCGC